MIPSNRNIRSSYFFGVSQHAPVLAIMDVKMKITTGRFDGSGLIEGDKGGGNIFDRINQFRDPVPALEFGSIDQIVLKAIVKQCFSHHQISLIGRG